MPSTQAQAHDFQPSSLRTRLGVLTLLLLCGIQFMDVADTSIVNVALPSIQHSLRFSQQNPQWVASGYLLTYGGLPLLGGRAADLLGRPRVWSPGLSGSPSARSPVGWRTARGC
jgi:MFS family permease